MTAQATPIFLQAGSHPAEDVRRMLWSLTGRRGGIVGTADLAVTQNGTPNMTTIVADGDVFIPGTEGTYQGVYHCENRGNTTVTHTTADPTNPRRDLVVARVRDAAYSGAVNSFAIEAVAGTPAASPVDPATPANSWVLARVAIAAAATTIVTGNITDLRTTGTGQAGRASAVGGVIFRLQAAPLPSNPQVGQLTYETDSKLLYAYNGATWDLLASVPTAWTAPTLLNSWVNFGAGNVDAAYRKVGDIVYLRGQLKNGTTTAGTVILTLPVGFRPLATVVVPTLDGNNAIARFDVQTNGNVVIQVGANNAFGITTNFSTL